MVEKDAFCLSSITLLCRLINSSLLQTVATQATHYCMLKLRTLVSRNIRGTAPRLDDGIYASRSDHPVRTTHLQAVTAHGPRRKCNVDMKRKEPPTKAAQTAKKPRADIPEYHLTPSVEDDDGSVRWPAPRVQVERARELILQCAAANKKVLIVPDKDADGLSAGAILRHTLILLGLPAEKIAVHLLSKGTTIHSAEERLQMEAHQPAFAFIVDHGSRAGPPVIDAEHVALIIDHHHATDADFPKGSEHVTACFSPPVATSALLTYELCAPLHPDVRARCDWLCCVGTHGDLGTTLKWEPPFPDMKECLKKYTKKCLNDVVSLVNAPRRTATYDTIAAWSALCETAEPSSVLSNPRLLAARAEVNAEVERCTHAAPKFTPDGKVAVFKIKSEAQVHPVIATRWAGHLNSKALEIVMVANEGYLPGKVNFSCRIARCARGRDVQVSIIDSLKHYAGLALPEMVDGLDVTFSGPPATVSVDDVRRPLLERVGDDFARGHVQASGGIVSVDHFEELMWLMQVGVKANKKDGVGSSPKKKSTNVPVQKNTLMGYFKQSG